MTSSFKEEALNKENLSQLYEKDYYLWLEATRQLLAEGKLTELDIENLSEEIADMGRSEKRAIASNLEVLLMHLLKYKYQPAKQTNSWRYTIYEHRKRLKKAFNESPSLKKYFQQIFDESYQEARKMASIETGLAIKIFPEVSPFSEEDTLNDDYLPE
ncbi:MAG: DUF29 domain-containing protein [Chroococcales cyanobacterium]